MNWNTFRNLLPASRVCLQGHNNTIERTLRHRANVRYLSFGDNPWYPKNVQHGGFMHGCRYVDMGKSYVGDQDAFCSEANYCALVVMIDPHGPTRFLAHISADTEITDIQPDLRLFLQAIGDDMGRAEVFIFRGASQSSDEPDVLMELLSSVMSDQSLQWMAMRTYFIEGERNSAWRAHSSVYSIYKNAAHSLDVTYAY